MRFGAFTFPTDYSLPITEVARALEAHGFDSLWVPEHTHMPASVTELPGGFPLPRRYRHTLDPFVALAAAAAVTTTLELGTGVCLLPQRDTLVTAKEVASLDHLSGGRFHFGIGAGWNRPEYEHHRPDFAGRWGVMREQVEALKALWTQDEASYHGSRVTFDAVTSWPKPVRKPHPPIVLGGNGPRTLQRVVAYADAWMPILGGADAPEERIPELRELAAAAGRGHIPVLGFWARPEPAELERLAGAGVEEVIFDLPPASAGDVLPLVERYGAVAAAHA
jgi:probable F420-dependent oxidoreductase